MCGITLLKWKIAKPNVGIVVTHIVLLVDLLGRHLKTVHPIVILSKAVVTNDESRVDDPADHGIFNKLFLLLILNFLLLKLFMLF